jgi:hypothetical protein
MRLYASLVVLIFVLFKYVYGSIVAGAVAWTTYFPFLSFHSFCFLSILPTSRHK